MLEERSRLILVTERCSSSSSWGGGGAAPVPAGLQCELGLFPSVDGRSGLSDGLHLWVGPLGWSSAAGQLGPESANQQAGSEKLLQVGLQERDRLSVSFPDALHSLTPADGLRVVTAGRSPPDRPERRQPRWLGLPNTYQRCGQDTLER